MLLCCSVLKVRVREAPEGGGSHGPGAQRPGKACSTALGGGDVPESQVPLEGDNKQCTHWAVQIPISSSSDLSTIDHDVNLLGQIDP